MYKHWLLILFGLISLPGWTALQASERKTEWWFFAPSDQGTAQLSEDQAICFRDKLSKVEVDNARLISESDKYQCHTVVDATRPVNWRMRGELHLRNMAQISELQQEQNRINSDEVIFAALSAAFILLWILGLILYTRKRKSDIHRQTVFVSVFTGRFSMSFIR